MLLGFPGSLSILLRRLLTARCVLGRLRRHLVAFQQRIALELGLDEQAQLDVGQLEQTNGLLQLGCHHQLLALPQLQLRRKHHNGPDRRQDVSRGQGITTLH
jgi:hypothetical protein